MLEQLMMRLKGKYWLLMLLLIVVVTLAACGPAPAPEVIEKVVTKEMAVIKEMEVVVTKEAPAVAEETKVIVLELADVDETPVLVGVKNRQPLELNVVDTKAGRLHFRLEIDTDDYPPGNDFELEVMAISTENIAKICEGQEVCKQYPEVSGVTEDGRLIIVVDGQYMAVNPYAFSVTGIENFRNPVSVSISVDIPPEEESEDHGIIIYHEDDEAIKHFSARLVEDDNGFLLAVNPDDSDDPIYHCCRAHAHCSSGPACLKCE